MAESELSAFAKRRFGIRLHGVPVLLYHGLTRSEFTGDPFSQKYCIFLSQFQEQLDCLEDGGWQVCLLRELWTHASTTEGSGRAVAITFDDGLVSDYELALPSLVAKKRPADFFINTSRVGEAAYLTWKNVEEMHRAGMGIHSHSHDHVALSLLSVRELETQLQRSKDLLETHLNIPMEFLAVPYGFVNKRVVDVALKIGYKAICHSFPWTAEVGAALVNRVAIYRETSRAEFIKILCGHPVPYLFRAARSALSYFPKQLLLRYRPCRLGVEVLENRA